MDVSQYLDIFLDESREHLQSLNNNMLELEQNSENMDTINEIFRSAHTLKGMAGTMGFKRMQTLTHDMENVFSEVRDGNIKVNSDMIDVLFQCLDALEGYVSIIQETSDEGDNDNQPIINALNACLTGKKADAAATPAEEKPAKKSAKKSTKSKAKADTKAAEEKKEGAPAPAVSMKLSEEEQKAVEDAMMANRKLYHITVTVQDTCLLKAARAFLVFKAIEDHGEVLATNPSTQDIEDEKFDFVFQILIATDGELQPILDAIKTVSEIGDAVGVPFSGESAVSSEEPAEEEEAPAKEEDKETLPAEAPQEAASKPAPAAAQTPAAAPAKKPAGKPAVNRTVRVDIEKLDSLMNLVSELIIAKNSLVSSATSLGNNSNQLNDHIEYLESVTTNLHESVMKVRMVPIESVVTKFPRMIRDLSKKLNKPIELYMTGEDTELDRTVVDEIGDPLMHLLRNSADHGIEDPEIRAQRGKPEVGSIYLDAYQDGNNVVIEVKDDGNGIDVEAVKRKAIERGVLTEEQAAVSDDNDIIRLLFLPSFSTAKKVTDVSGRGVGLDVVKSKIESLSGEVDVKSKLGEGSTFSIRLPLTLAIIQALMVVVGDEKYAIALGGIQTIEDISPSDIKTVQGSEVINLRGNVIPLVRLDKVVGVESKRSPEDNMVVVIAKKGDKLAGFIVDELIGQQEIVIKSMGKYINKCKFISGATILGDGEIALIIDANALM
ncbi:two-component system, chemotaxis family, sensor kinase CheA [Lachnospiraceae bacterium XPB1003]|nr:two-component system, chemotaxis family, sensor kinase CheA [Lachnospiraceae bacterium XPB1003]